jgi:hypothetical protein
MQMLQTPIGTHCLRISANIDGKYAGKMPQLLQAVLFHELLQPVRVGIGDVHSLVNELGPDDFALPARVGQLSLLKTRSHDFQAGSRRKMPTPESS